MDRAPEPRRSAWSRLLRWLDDVPIADDFERHNARSVQLFLIGLIVMISVGEVTTWLLRPRDPGAFVGWYSPFANGATVAVSAWALVAIRRGRAAFAFRLLLVVFVGVLVVSFALRGMQWHEHFFVRTYAVLLVIAALLVGRAALWATMAALLFGFGLGWLHDRVWAAPMVGDVPAEGHLVRALEVALILCILIDRFGVALREAYAASRSRAAELEATLQRLREESDRRKEAEAMLIEAQRMESLGRLSGGVAHDFNNILTAIRGFTGFAQDAVGPDHPAQASLQQVQVAAGRAAALTAQLLAFARREVVEPRVLDVGEQVRLALPLLIQLLGPDIAVVTRLPAESLRVRIDPTRLEQVLVNLAINARDAMADGGTLTIALAARHDGDGGRVELVVSDDGAGMDAETARHAFEPFFTTKALRKGTGLGLATCHGIVHQAGGTVTVQSAPGRGSTFRVSLPRVVEPPDPVPQDAAKPARRSVRGESILVVDDDDQIRAMIARHLGRAGYAVRAADSAAEVRQLVENEGVAPDLLLTDVVLPEGDGRSIARWLQQRHAGSRVLYMSGNVDQLTAVPAVPAAAMLPKPFTLDELLARVDGLLATPAGAPPPAV